MALTNKAIPAVPVRTLGGAVNHNVTHTITYPAASATYKRGQLVTLSATLGYCAAATAADATSATGMPVGIVAADQTIAANADPLLIYPALPTTVFRGTIAGGADTNGVFVQADVGELRELVEVAASNSVTGAVLIAVSTVATATKPEYSCVRLQAPEHDIQPAGGTSAVSTLSPWVCFTFAESLWTTGGRAYDTAD